MTEFFDRHWRKVAFLLGLAGFGFILLITSRYGAGVSGDAVDYLSTADSLKRGAGFTDFAGEPYIYWPPLYPLLLAGLSWMLHLDTFVVGWWLNALGFGVVIYLMGVLLRKIFPAEPLWWVWGSLTILTSLSLVQLAANILSDVVFIVLLMLYAVWGGNYLERPTRKCLIGLSLLAGAAAVLRWHGVLVVASVVLLALIARRGSRKIALIDAVWSGGLASLPFALWVFGRNYRLFGSFLGYRDTANINRLTNFGDAFQKIAHWFLPEQLLNRFPAVWLMAGGLILLLLFTSKNTLKQFAMQLLAHQNLPWLIFLFLDFIFIILTSIPYDHAAYFDDRYAVPLFGFVVLLLGLGIQHLLLKPLSKRRPVARLLLIAVMALWLLYPAYRIYKYALVTREHGEQTYNMYNSERFRQSALVRKLSDPGFDPTQALYSNYPAAVYFYTRQITQRAPISSSGEPTDYDDLYTRFANWPPEEQATLIWFLPNDWHYYYTPDDLTAVAELKIEFSSPDGEIYSVTRNDK